MKSEPCIVRWTIWPVRIPVPRERLHCPSFIHEPLSRGPSGGFDGPWFADVPIYAVKAESSDGTAGYGDVARAYEVPQMLEIASKFLGSTVDSITLTDDPTPRPAGTRGLHSAVLDWKARQMGVPLHALFGKPVRDRVKVSMWSGFRTPQGAAAVARDALEKYGIRSLKLKAGEDTDCAGIAGAVCEAVGGRDYDLVLDSNGRWPDFEDAVRRATEAVKAAPGIRVYFEDPGIRNDACPELKRRSGIGIARTGAGAADVEKLVRVCEADLLNLVRDWESMITGADEVARLNRSAWAGSSVTSALGDVASLHFAMAKQGMSFGADMAASQSREHSLLTRAIEVKGGYAIIPQGPGLGVDLDIAAAERYAVGETIIVE